MSEKNFYKNPEEILKITKFTSSIKTKLISFISNLEIDELNILTILGKDLSKENLEHKLNTLIDINNIFFYFLEEDNEIIGLYILSLGNKINDISFIIKKDKRNKGYGKIGLHLLIKELSSSQPDINEYYFVVPKKNIYGILVIFGNNAYIFKETDTEYILKIEKNNNVWIHKVSKDDLPKVMIITASAKKLLKSNGSLQWQQGYPNEETFTNDIKNGNLYGLYEDNELRGYGAYIFGKDLNYVEIEGGKWEIPANDKDMAIHRVAVDENCHGKKYGIKILEYGVKYARKLGCLTVKVDTHKNNIPMQKCISKSGFIYRGIIKILTEKLDNLRLAYEIVL
jgi:predicted acetyltransferase